MAVDTSEEAAARIEPNRLARQVLGYVRMTRWRGATCDDVEVGLGMRHQTASARCRELELARRIVKTQDKRPTRSGRPARVYKVPEHVKS